MMLDNEDSVQAGGGAKRSEVRFWHAPHNPERELGGRTEISYLDSP